MKLLKLWRTFKEGTKNFFRNGWLSFATVSIISVSLFIMSLTILLAVGSSSAIRNVQEKINVSVYFNPEVSEERIKDIKDTLSGFKEVKTIEYVSKEKALEQLMSSSSGQDPTVKKALDEIGENPLFASLVIKAQDPSQYEAINDAVNRNYSEEISWINYEKNRDEIQKLGDIIKTGENVGIVLGIIFIIIAVMITFNTIRITIYAHKQEFEIMRLVGASNMYVRMPYIFEGIFYGISSAIVVLILLFVTFQFIAPMLQNLVPKELLVSLYFEYFSLTAFFLFLTGILLGVASSFIAVRRYLKI